MAKPLAVVGLNVERSLADPAAVPLAVQFYSKMAGGVAQLFAEDSAGNVYQLTPTFNSVATNSFGSGVDGPLNFDGVSNVTLVGDGTVLVPTAGVYSLPRSLWATNMTVAVGATIRTQRQRIFVNGVLTLDGAIEQDGGNGANGGNASGGAGGQNNTATGSGSVVFPVPGAGGSGTSGAGGSGSQSNATNKPLGTGTAAIAANNNGGRMQGGGGGSTASAGGGSPSNTGYNTAEDTSYNVWQQAVIGRAVPQVLVQVGSGGGGGAGSAAPSSSVGGGGGAPGATVFVAARTIVGTGRISARGGNGGNATFAGAPAGGGGGGAGGIVIVGTASNILTLPIVISAAGGLGGAGIAGGNNGGIGGDGFVYLFQL
jgi:hypothetical protein